MTALYPSKMLLLETMLIYTQNIELRLSIGIDYSASTLSLSLFKKIQHGVSKREISYNIYFTKTLDVSKSLEFGSKLQW